MIQGDCLEVMKGVDSNSIDSIVTDPPYGIDFKPQRGNTLAIQNDGLSDAQQLWQLFVPEFYRVLKNNTASLIFAGKMEGWAVELLKEHFIVKDAICWYKNMWGIGRYLRPQWEIAWYVHKGVPPTLGDKAGSNVWEVARLQKPIHSCQKPVELMERAILLCNGDLILDPFAGSGSTLVAAKKLGRNFIGIELDEGYVEIARKRLTQQLYTSRDSKLAQQSIIRRKFF